MRRLAVLLCAASVACRGAPPADEGSVTIAAVDTLVDTESATLAYAADLDVARDGTVWAADVQADRILRIDPETGDATPVGRPGEGPGELDAPWTLRAVDDGVLVVDRGNGRVQRLGRDGAYLASTPVTPMVMRSMPFLGRDGSLVIGSGGRDSCLAVVFDSASTELRRIGDPVVVPPPMADFTAIKAAIAEGEMPADLRNDAMVAADREGAVWVALQTEGEIRRYDATGAPRWSLTVDEPEMAATRAEFFRRNQEEKNPARFIALRYFRDVVAVGGELWVLLDTPPEARAVVLVVPADGGSPRRIEVAGAGGSMTMAVDAERRRLYLFSAHDAQLLVAALP